MNAGPQHVIFGTGAVGLATLDALRRRGETARLVNRSGTAPVPDDIEVLGGDASDPAFTTAAARGARVVYQTLNPPYHQWAELFPALQAGVLAAAQASGARLVSMENVYMYGRPNGQPLTETRPYAARTKKGTLRARMARELLAAHQAGNVQVVIGRASDYFGPRGGAQSMLGDRVIPARPGRQDRHCPGRPRPAPHLHLSARHRRGPRHPRRTPRGPGRGLAPPQRPRTRTTRQLAEVIYQLAGQPRTKLRSTPVLLLRALGVTNPTVRELLELQYEFQEPFIVDSTKIATKLDVHATPLDQALAGAAATYGTSPAS